jgi:competence protein ComEA
MTCIFDRAILRATPPYIVNLPIGCELGVIGARISRESFFGLNLLGDKQMNRFLMLLAALVMATFNVFAAVNVNTATQEQLESLNGIGPAKAKAIIDYRQKNGGFKTIDELEQVPGVGKGLLGKIKNDVTLSGESSVKVEAKSATRKSEPAKLAPAATPAVPAVKAEAPVDAKAEKKAAAKAEKEAKKAEQEAKKTARKAEKEAKKAEERQ